MHDQQIQEEGFIGRHEELLLLARWAGEAGTAAGESHVLTGDAGVGKTALLQRLAGHLFWKQDRVAPFLYSASPAIVEARDLARDYVTSFLRQRLSFENRDQALLGRSEISLQELAERAADQGSAWAGEFIEAFQRADDPLSRIQAALQAPALSVRATGRPVAVMIDDFPVLEGLHRGSGAEPSLLALFAEHVAAHQTPHLLAGSAAALRELPLPALSAIQLGPLQPRDGSRLLQELLQARGVPGGGAPPALLDLLNGNPLYLRRIASAARGRSGSDNDVFWTAYVHELTEGGLHRFFLSKLAALFPAASERRSALEVIHRVCASGARAAVPAAALGIGADKLSPAASQALLRSGFLLAGFGGYRAPDDGVLRDFIRLLYDREIAGKPLDEIIRRALAERHAAPPHEQSWDLVVPLAPRAELVVAQGLEQIGKNLHLAEETIGQLQMAVIEACINAIEHTRGGDRRLYATIRTLPDRLEASIESRGSEFMQADAREPLAGLATGEGSPRGQGIKLMKRFTDEVRFERTSRGTRVVLVKRLPRTTTMRKEEVSQRE